MLRLTFLGLSVALASGQECSGGDDVCLLQLGGVLSADGSADSEAELAESLGLGPQEANGLWARAMAEAPPEERDDISDHDLHRLLQASSSSVGGWGYGTSGSGYGRPGYYSSPHTSSSGGSLNSGSHSGSSSAWMDALDPKPSDACSFDLEVTPAYKHRMHAIDCRSWESTTRGQKPGKCIRFESLPADVELRSAQDSGVTNQFLIRFIRGALDFTCDKSSHNSLRPFWQLHGVFVNNVQVGWMGNYRFFYPLYTINGSRLQMIEP